MVWRGFPGGNSGKAPICQCRRRKRCGFHPWVGKIYWRSAWPPTPVFMCGEYAQTEEPDRLQIHRVTKSGSQLKHNMSSQTHRLKPQPPMWLSLETGLLRRGLILNMVIKFSSVQFSSFPQPYPTLCDPWNAARQVSPSITNSWSLLKLMSFELVMPSNHLILCRPLLLLPSYYLSIRGFSNESALHIRWPEYWSFSFNISPSKEYSGLISFRINWLDLLAVQGTLKSLLQHHSSKASILQCSAFFRVQLSHPYMITGKNISLTRWTFVAK